ncbi:MAG: hypothetical protein RLZZ292_3280 [Bacteroidota bacterium]|jgi:hypothetical protein
MTTLYQRQLQYIFNHPVTEPAWYWTDFWEEGVFENDPMCSFLFIETLLQNAKEDLSPFSDGQIGLGLNYIFNNCCSNLADDFKVADVPVERKVAAIKSLFGLFRDVLNPRCHKVLSAFSKDAIAPLSYICYMFWDITPIAIWNNVPSKEGKAYYEAIAFVMQECLYLSNPACVESALHGLGHLVGTQTAIAKPIIENYLKNKKNKNVTLKNYAEMALTGTIL